MRVRRGKGEGGKRINWDIHRYNCGGVREFGEGLGTW